MACKSIDQILEMHRKWRKKSESLLTSEQREISDEISDLLERARPWHGLSIEKLNDLNAKEAELFYSWQEDYQKTMLKAIKCNLDLLHNPVIEDWITSRKIFKYLTEDEIRKIKERG